MINYFVCWDFDLNYSALDDHLRYYEHRRNDLRRYCLVEAEDSENAIIKFLESEFMQGDYYELEHEIKSCFVYGAINDSPRFDESFSNFDKMLECHNCFAEILRTELAEEEEERILFGHEAVKQFLALLSAEDEKNYWIKNSRENVIAIRSNDVLLQGKGEVFMFDLEESLESLIQKSAPFEHKDFECVHPFVVRGWSMGHAAERFLDYLYEITDKKEIDDFVKRKFILDVYYDEFYIDEYGDSCAQLKELCSQLMDLMKKNKEWAVSMDKDDVITERYINSAPVVALVQSMPEEYKKEVWAWDKQYDLISTQLERIR